MAQTHPTYSVNDPNTCWYIGSIIDITTQVEADLAMTRLSEQRVAEAEERRREAILQKEQQALLVDVVSHELRNGCNPVLQSSLLIQNSLSRVKEKMTRSLQDGIPFKVDETMLANLNEDLSACEAIVDSSMQMERVANDVLVSAGSVRRQE